MDVSSICSAIFFHLNANNEYMARIFRRAITVHKLLISLSIGQTIAILKFYFLEAVENKENPLGPSSFTYIYIIYISISYTYMKLKGKEV